MQPWDHVLRPLRWAEGRPPPERRADDPPAVGRFGPDFSSSDEPRLRQRRFLATPYHPCTVGRSLIVADGFSVEARDLLSGRLQWRFPDADLAARRLGVVRPDEGVLDGRTNVDVAFAPCAADGLVYATVEVEDRTFTPRRLHMIDITTYRPRRVLVALDAATGALAWSMGATLDDARALEDVSVGGGPVVADGLVVVMGVRFLKRWEARLVAFDARTGRLVWQRKVVTSQQELNLFGEPVKEMWAGTPAIADGTVAHMYNGTKPGDPCYNGGGKECNNAANYVSVLHNDGTRSIYAHLSETFVAVGEKVPRGVAVGKSGSTGWSTGPHAHVARTENCNSSWCQSIAVSFTDVPGDGVPDTNDIVTSMNCP